MPTRSNPTSVTIQTPGQVPSFIPAVGQFARIPLVGSGADAMLNNAQDVQPSIANGDSYNWPNTVGAQGGLSDVFRQWGKRIVSTDFNPLGPSIVHITSDAHAGGGEMNWGMTVILDVIARRWYCRNKPSQPWPNQSMDGHGAQQPCTPGFRNYDCDNMYPDGTFYVPHTYGACLYLPTSAGGGPQGDILQPESYGGFFAAGISGRDLSLGSVGSASNLSRAQHGQYLYSEVTPPDVGDNRFSYDEKYDTIRGGWWGISQNGSGLIHFLSNSTKTYTTYNRGAWFSSSGIVRYPVDDLLIQFCGNSSPAKKIKGWQIGGANNFSDLQVQGTPPAFDLGTYAPAWYAPRWSPRAQKFMYYDAGTGAGGFQLSYGPNRFYSFDPPSGGPGNGLGGMWTWTSYDPTPAAGTPSTIPNFDMFNSGAFMVEVPLWSRPNETTFVTATSISTSPFVFVISTPGAP